ncbi:unnamed protein product [Rotaria sordida]|nr:unnamed protein product [Rotaria sordida]CAF3944672.1 unnamed protein product [Rotaria sordida]CAF4009694.1 unnamed protein product [Rotaria sordida]
MPANDQTMLREMIGTATTSYSPSSTISLDVNYPAKIPLTRKVTNTDQRTTGTVNNLDSDYQDSRDIRDTTSRIREFEEDIDRHCRDNRIVQDDDEYRLLKLYRSMGSTEKVKLLEGAEKLAGI